MFRVPATLGRRALAIDLVTAFVRHAVAADGLFHDEMLTAFSEAFNAVVLHAYEGRSDGMVEVEVEVGTEAVTLRLCDDGLAVDFTRPARPTLDETPSGVFLVHATVDVVAYEAGAPNVLTLTKQLRQAGR